MPDYLTDWTEHHLEAIRYWLEDIPSDREEMLVITGTEHGETFMGGPGGLEAAGSVAVALQVCLPADLTLIAWTHPNEPPAANGCHVLAFGRNRPTWLLQHIDYVTVDGVLAFAPSEPHAHERGGADPFSQIIDGLHAIITGYGRTPDELALQEKAAADAAATHTPIDLLNLVIRKLWEDHQIIIRDVIYADYANARIESIEPVYVDVAPGMADMLNRLAEDFPELAQDLAEGFQAGPGGIFRGEA